VSLIGFAPYDLLGAFATISFCTPLFRAGRKRIRRRKGKSKIALRLFAIFITKGAILI
jgi:hypothetical protein